LNATAVTTAADMYPVFVGAAGSALQPNVRTTATAYTFNPSTSNLTIGGTLTVNANGNAIAIVNGASNGVGNIGSSTTYFNTAFVKATSAQYADLAEMYVADKVYEPGTVLRFGGNFEVTETSNNHDTTVAGVVSTNPSYVMNSGQQGEFVVAVALQGRVPTKVTGPVGKGDRLVSSDIPGVAQRLDMDLYQPGTVIGKSLEEHSGNTIGVIEVVVGRL
jgi:hypothetical protein